MPGKLKTTFFLLYTGLSKTYMIFLSAWLSGCSLTLGLLKIPGEVHGHFLFGYKPQLHKELLYVSTQQKMKRHKQGAGQDTKSK